MPPRAQWIVALLAVAACRGPDAESHKPPVDPPSGEARPAQPHPDYPTSLNAGAEELFLLAEPQRGPHVTSAALPDRKQLKLSEHAYCEILATGIACTVVKPPAGAPAAHWNVGRAGDRVVLAEEVLAGGRVARSFVFDWDAAGKLARLVALDAHGAVDWARTFNPAGERYTERMLSGANALPGCGSLALKPDAAGRTREASCLQWNGKPMRDTQGVPVTQVRYDWQGFVAETVRLGVDRKPAAGHDGVHRVAYQRDPAGRVLAAQAFDLAGKPVLSTSDGCSGHRYEYDDRGVVTREVCLGKDGAPARADEGVAVTALESNVDGCVVGKHYFDREGQPTHVRGVYGLRLQVDPVCAELSSVCIGADQNPTACGPGEPAEYDVELDDRGRAVSVKHRGADGDPAHDAEYEVFELRKEWDPLGNLVGQSCWGASGEAVECDHTEYHAEKIKVDDAGRNREVRYFGVDGAPATNMGVAIRSYVYDNFDHIHEIDGFDAAGNAVETRGMATQRRLYDAGHRLFALLLLDKTGRPARYTACFTGRDCPTRDWHAVRIFRGANGHVTKNEYFDADGQLVYTLDCDSQRCWQ